jgi:hypothetical protein
MPSALNNAGDRIIFLTRTLCVPLITLQEFNALQTRIKEQQQRVRTLSICCACVLYSSGSKFRKFRDILLPTTAHSLPSPHLPHPA